jgi:START domain
MKNTLFSLSLIAISLTSSSFAQHSSPEPCSAWKQADERGNLKVYVRECDDSPIKEFKVNDRFKGDFTKLVRIMDDPSTIKILSERCTEARDIKTLANNQIVQYYYFDMPMGITDRDVVSKISIWKTETAYKTLAESVTEDYVPLKKDVIRLQKVRTSFYFEKQTDGTIFMEYTGKTDPNGWVPAWLVNMLATREARKLVDKLKYLVQN